MNEKIRNTTPRHFTDLKVWKDAHDLYLFALKDVEDFPNTRGSYTLADQLLRSIGSISANISEGFNRRSTKHYILKVRKPGICLKCLSMVNTVRLYSRAMADMQISDNGICIPLFFNEADDSPALCHKDFDISAYGMSDSADNILTFSASDCIPCKSSNRTMPHTQTEFSNKGFEFIARL